MAVLLLAACAPTGPVSQRAPSPTPSVIAAAQTRLHFRVLREAHNPKPCIHGPEVALARTDDDWINVFDRQTACNRMPEVRLPDVDFAREIGVAIWWNRPRCDTLHIQAVTFDGASIRIDAGREATRATSPTLARSGRACPRGASETFLAVRRWPAMTGTEVARAFLNDAEIAATPPMH